MTQIQSCDLTQLRFKPILHWKNNNQFISAKCNLQHLVALEEIELEIENLSCEKDVRQPGEEDVDSDGNEHHDRPEGIRARSSARILSSNLAERNRGRNLQEDVATWMGVSRRII